MTPSAIQCVNVSFAYARAPIVRNLTLAVGRGELLAILGPSGCGKTTLLKLLGGYIVPSFGRILLDDADITHAPPNRRSVGMVFQQLALFPHLSGARNIAFGLEIQGNSPSTIRQRVGELLDLVRLGAADAERLPSELSGGQQQRIALARALAIRPRVLLLDEAFASLDRTLRVSLRTELRRIHEATAITTILVTHDAEDALSLADRIAVLDRGVIVQHGSPQDIYERPTSEFVARLMGDVNSYDGQWFRPECVWFGGPHHGVVSEVRYGGREWLVTITCERGLIQMRSPTPPTVGERVRIGWPTNQD